MNRDLKGMVGELWQQLWPKPCRLRAEQLEQVAQRKNKLIASKNKTADCMGLQSVSEERDPRVER